MKRRRIAIVGMGCRYPMAENPEELWKVLIQKKCCDMPMERRFPQYKEYYNPDMGARGKFYNQRGFFLSSDITKFDADFFHISFMEAEQMDYQQRMLMEVSYEALEDAGLKIEGGDTGVYIGGFMQDFLTNSMQRSNTYHLTGYHATGSSIGMLANRLSYYYDLHGPSLTVDTACSSSLTALHLASESIAQGRCRTAICGGVNIITELGNFITLSKGGFLSRQSMCSAFGADADGYARGEGVGVLILKDLEQAVEDKDWIYCEIAASAINHDGKTNGITYPSANAQINLMNRIYGGTGLNIDEIGYIEAHGTGTQAGDRTELQALQAIFGKKEQKLIVGSIKSNIGHTEAAAGIASVIKAALMLKHGVIPATLHCETKNPNIPFGQYNIEPAESERPLAQAKGGGYYIGINGFGFGGSNAHVVVASVEKQYQEEARTEEKSFSCSNFYLSAGSKTSLLMSANQYMVQMQNGSLRSNSLSEICACAATRRIHRHPFKLAVTASTKEDLAKGLWDFCNNKNNEDVQYQYQSKGYGKTAAVFSGMGAQNEAMGKELYRDFPVFRSTFDQCSQVFEEFGGESLSAEMQSSGAKKGFFKVGFLQPYNLAYQIALYELAKSFGILFEGYVGHSAGELAAFYCSGFLSLRETFRIALHRGRVQEQTQGRGKMLVLELNRQRGEAICEAYEGRVSLGVVNGANTVVLSGEREALEEIYNTYQGQTYTKFLKGSVAYHSFQMEDVKEAFEKAVNTAPHNQSFGRLYSTVLGDRIHSKNYEEGYWWKNIRNTVEFSNTMEAMRRDGYDSFIEIGPLQVLFHYIAEVYYNAGFSCVSLQKSPQEQSKAFFRGWGRAYLNQIPMELDLYFGKRQMLPLPNYQWNGKALPNKAKVHLYEDREREFPHLGCKLNLPQEVWENKMNLASHPWLKGHRAAMECYMPTTAYIAMLAEAGNRSLEKLEILYPVILEDKEDKILSLTKTPKRDVEVYVADTDRRDWRKTFSAKVCRKNWDKEFQWPADWVKDSKTVLEEEAVYQILEEKSLSYRDSFRLIHSAYIGEDYTFAKLRTEPCCREGEQLPGVLDTMLQAAALAGSRELEFDRRYAFLPLSLEKTAIYGPICGELWVGAKVVEKTEQSILANTFMFDGAHNLLAAFWNVRFGVKEVAAKDSVDVYTNRWDRLKSTDFSLDSGPFQHRKPIVFQAGGDGISDTMEIIKIVEQIGNGQRHLVVLTKNSTKVLKSDGAEGYEQAALWGLCRCIRLEYSNLEITLVDADDLEYAKSLFEKGISLENEFELAIRKKELYGLRFVPEESVAASEKEWEDTAILTGASGGLAYQYALHLAQRGVKNIVLISRNQTARIKRLVEVLEYYGVGTRFYQVDVTCLEQVTRCFSELEDSIWGKKAVYHLAGYNQDCPALEITARLLQKHIEPKLKGALNLSKALAKTGETLYLFGSVVAPLGNPGQGAYAAANMQVQCFSEFSKNPLIGFGALDTGMSQETKQAIDGFSAQGIEVMDTEAAIAAVDRAASPIRYVTQMNWGKLLEQRNLLDNSKFLSVKGEKKTGDSFLDSWRKGSYETQEKMLQEFLAEAFAGILNMEKEEINMDRNTDTMGIHSLGATLLAGKINQGLKIHYTSVSVTGAFSIRDMAMRIHRQLLTGQMADSMGEAT